ncbi:DMT family transporter [Bradyrhizobium sp. AUGA SZCCT0283]|uniref:DMT family transporter n=1 Tax=Bradyrhizobium sp. AUGA SZCCT0283 TaxID=2807671 RepID=UPI001BA93F5B|nr:DMT family transporter [Bradyrhizobium sp. AUGA SZCCT0283]
MTAARFGGDTNRHRWLLIFLILIWAISWPVIKVGVTAVPAIWFGCLRYMIAAFCLFALVALRRQLAFPSRSDWSLIAVSGALQMAAYSALTGLALTILPPGRASVLAFSTPIWVVPLAAWWLHERISQLAMFGVAVGLSGVFVIAAPSLHVEGKDQIAAYGMLMGAAAAWAISIVFVRSHRFAATTLALAPWQMLVAAALLLPLALGIEGSPPPIGASGAASLAYVGPIATAFAYWAVVEVGRHFQAGTISMALLATPSLGILISALTLGEAVGASLIAGVVLIAAGIRLATSTSDRQVQSHQRVCDR